MHLVHNLTSKEWFCLCGEPQYPSFTTVSIVTLPCNEHIRYWYKHQPRVSHMLIWIKSSVLAVICSLATFQPRFRDPYLRPVRAATFGSLAIFTMVPVVHGLHKYGWDIQRQRMGVVWVLVTLVLNVSGAMAYAFKVCWSDHHVSMKGFKLADFDPGARETV